MYGLHFAKIRVDFGFRIPEVNWLRWHGLEWILCEILSVDIRKYDAEDKILKDLIETNIRQRGIGNPNPVKLGRCFEFLNNWYGFKQGTNQYSLSKLLISSEEYCPKNQTELAESYGITTQTMNNYVRMANMIPELEDLVDTGILAPTTTID